MIWDQKPPVVVMLTRLFEKGKVAKCTTLSDTTMSIVIYAGVKFVEKVNERDCILTNQLELTNLDHVDQVKPFFMHMQSKCERYWCDEMNEPFEIPDRGFTVTVTGKKVYADYEIRDMTIRSVSVYTCKKEQCVQID